MPTPAAGSWVSRVLTASPPRLPRGVENRARVRARARDRGCVGVAAVFVGVGLVAPVSVPAQNPQLLQEHVVRIWLLMRVTAATGGISIRVVRCQWDPQINGGSATSSCGDASGEGGGFFFRHCWECQILLGGLQAALILWAPPCSMVAMGYAASLLVPLGVHSGSPRNT